MYTDEKGNFKARHELAVVNRYGEILEQLDSKDNSSEFVKKVSELEKKYNLSDGKRFDNMVLANEYLNVLGSWKIRLKRS